MINEPVFKSKLLINKAETLMETENTGIYNILDADFETTPE
ncbi:MAG: hypothetical protein KKF46_05130 [Nanoarchaeota archaeon]|nr:hypothetical protein [Nanoarchaeota archaeon]MBU1321717.1 hypothetical protein [Nanoarchaeota archaeon]MBU1597683.1 hypothetical protein [Nanoarchaeota archaeon]MBU2441017.1 hypothetical protein [Nanoarchaeota archaeon]